MLSLTDAQLKQVMVAAGLIAPAARDDFLRHLAAQLEGALLSDARLSFVLHETLAQHGLAVGRGYFRKGGDHGSRAVAHGEGRHRA